MKWRISLHLTGQTMSATSLLNLKENNKGYLAGELEIILKDINKDNSILIVEAYKFDNLKYTKKDDRKHNCYYVFDNK